MSTIDMDDLVFSRDRIEASDVFISYFESGFMNDPMFAFEMGLAVLLDKNIYLLVKTGEIVPLNLQRVAKSIEFYTDQTSLDAAAGRMAHAMNKAMRMSGAKIVSEDDLQIMKNRGESKDQDL